MNNEHINENVEELREIKRYLKVLSASAVMDLLNKVASTPERQQMWRLSDGSHSNDEISKQTGVTPRAVQYFVQESESMGLIENERRGYPKRILDIFPKEWKPWKPAKEKGVTSPTTNTPSGEEA
jgi:hypothetical protein